jgi:CHAT domain-containing protein
LTLTITQKGSPRRLRIHWCLTGSSQFNPTPVHAAGVYQGDNQECISDYVISSYTPTLAALLRARQNPQTFQADQLRLSILGMTESAGPKPALPMLASVDVEMQSVAEVATHAGVTCTSSPSATQDEASVLLSTANIIHVACPGIYIEGPPDDKLQSAFYLADGQLTLSEIVEMNRKHGFLAFLSACGTVNRCKETKHVDEVVDLPAAMLFVGFQSVVGTMW